MGLFALLYGIKPQQVYGWYLAVYVDAVGRVELPNLSGMTQYGYKVVLASKPCPMLLRLSIFKRMSNIYSYLSL